MVIRRSAAGEIRQLLDKLSGGDPPERDAAVARLVVLGPRAVPAVIAALQGTLQPDVRVALLGTLEAIRDPRALAPALEGVGDSDGPIAAAAIAVLRALLYSSDLAISNAAFERVTSVALDPSRPEPLRTSALEALSDLGPQAVAEVLRQLHEDASVAVRRAASDPHDTAERPATLADLAAATQCPDPEVLRQRLADEGSDAPLPVFARLLDAFREREAADSASPRRIQWQAARAAVHQALAARGSRLGLADLRESLANIPGPLPVGFLAAVERVGDASCLDNLSAAYLRARHAGDAWWTGHLQTAFRAILRREHLTRRSPAVRRVITRWPDAAAELLPPRR